MIHKETHLCTVDNGPRPAGPSDRCFYCGVTVGELHKKDCVLRNRTVVVESIIRYVIDIPESWSGQDISFRDNESSFCSNNIIDRLSEIISLNTTENTGLCFCRAIRTYYVREASEAEETTRIVRDF